MIATFSNLAKDIRTSENLSQERFARKLGVPLRSYIRFEKGQSCNTYILEVLLGRYNLDICVNKKPVL